MRAFLLSAVLGIATVGWMAVAPAQARADSNPGLHQADNVLVQWTGRRWNRPGWWGNTNYYYPGYATYYYPYSNYTYYPGYSSYYYTPATTAYYSGNAYYYPTTPGNSFFYPH